MGQVCEKELPISAPPQLLNNPRPSCYLRPWFDKGRDKECKRGLGKSVEWGTKEEEERGGGKSGKHFRAIFTGWRENRVNALYFFSHLKHGFRRKQPEDAGNFSDCRVWKDSEWIEFPDQWKYLRKMLKVKHHNIRMTHFRHVHMRLLDWKIERSNCWESQWGVLSQREIWSGSQPILPGGNFSTQRVCKGETRAQLSIFNS